MFLHVFLGIYVSTPSEIFHFYFYRLKLLRMILFSKQWLFHYISHYVILIRKSVNMSLRASGQVIFDISLKALFLDIQFTVNLNLSHFLVSSRLYLLCFWDGAHNTTYRGIRCSYFVE